MKTKGLWRGGQAHDWVNVQRARRGVIPAAQLTTAERDAVVRQLVQYERFTDRKIAEWLRWGPDPRAGRDLVAKFRSRHGIPAAAPCGRRAA